MFSYDLGTIQETASCGSLFDQQSGFFHYGVLFKFLLSTTAQAYWDIEKENKLPTGIEIGIHNRNFRPCKDCLVSPDDPITHCQKCIPVVTHTRQGLCVLLKGHGKVLIMDLIPVLPSPQEVTEPLMRMYRLITTSLLKEKHPGWKKAFMAYFTKDKVLPDEMHQLTQPEENDSPDDRYILIKLMHYGPEPNYQIRATQSIDAISKLTSEHADCLSYQYAKTLTKLLGIKDVSSYLMKKAFLSRTNYLRGTMTIHQNGEQQRWNLYNIITSPELKKFFASKLDFENPKFPEKLALDGIILLKDDL